MENIRRKCNPKLDLSKFTYNKKILNEVVALDYNKICNLHIYYLILCHHFFFPFRHLQNIELLIIFIFTKLLVWKNRSTIIYMEITTQDYSLFSLLMYVLKSFFNFPAIIVVSFYQFLNIVFSSCLQKDANQTMGCYNLLCSPGFVQINKEIALGGSLNPLSVYAGSQYELNFLVWKVVQYFNLITLLNISNFLDSYR